MSWDIQPQMDDWRAQGLWRELRLVESAQGALVKVDGREMINFSSNDYLGLADSPVLRQAMQEGVELYGAGSGASRLVCGTLKPHRDLEDALAAFKGTEAALAFSSGYATAMGTIPVLVSTGDTIILDKLCHASLVDAARLSGATIRVFPHNHLGKLEKLLASAKGRVLVVTESIFSMDGDAAALREIVELKEKHGAWLLLDELNRSLRLPAVDSAKGGQHGGGSALTDVGRQLIALYRRIEANSALACAKDIQQLMRMLAR